MERLANKGIAYGGFNREVFSFKWIIKDFKTVISSPSLIAWQETFVTTTVHDSIWAHSELKWKVALNEIKYSPKENWLAIYFSPENREKLKGGCLLFEAAAYSDAEEKITPILKDMSAIVNTDSIQRCVGREYPLLNELMIRKFINLASQLDEIPLVDGALTIHIRMHFFSKKNPGTCNSLALDKAEDKRFHQLLVDIGGPYISDVQSSDVKIYTLVDCKEILAHKKVLEARSPVFKTMFQSGLSEQKTRIVKIPDISSNTMKIMLEYMYTAKILTEELKDGNQVVDLAYAAEKYQLKLLKDACDDMLAKKCTKADAFQLLDSAEKLGLTKAKEEIIKFIRFHWNVGNDIDFNSVIQNRQMLQN